ncbi:MAG: hypothetical protein NTW21_24790 [Verrucomicrobia bacterium]|nr:hypothetical protein [Verrucomicrobiota bacterium]
MHWLALSHDGALLFTSDGTPTGTSPNRLAVLRVADGSVVASRNLPVGRKAYLSPNDKYIFLPHESGLGGKPICLLDSATLDIIWLSSPPHAYEMVAFRADSSEVGAVGTNSGGLFGTSVAKIWDTASGTVHLEATTDFNGPRWFHFLSDGRAVAGTCLYESVGKPQ